MSVRNGISLHCPDLVSFLSSWGLPVHTDTYHMTAFSNGHGQIIWACPPLPESVSISEQEDPRGYKEHRVRQWRMYQARRGKRLYMPGVDGKPALGSRASHKQRYSVNCKFQGETKWGCWIEKSVVGIQPWTFISTPALKQTYPPHWETWSNSTAALMNYHM